MRPQLRNWRIGCLAASLAVAGAGAQPSPAEATIDLTPRDRVVIYRSIIAAPPPPPPTVDFQVGVGAVVPEAVELYAIPPTVRVEPVAPYRYTVIGRQVVLVDPRTREVIEVIDEE